MCVRRWAIKVESTIKESNPVSKFKEGGTT